MSKITFKVASEEDNYSESVDIISQVKTTLFFEIELKENDVKQLRMVVPVWNTDKGVTDNPEKKDCLFTSEVWYGKSGGPGPFKPNLTEGIESIALEKDKTLGIINMSNIPTNTSVKIKFSFPDFIPDIDPSSENDGTGVATGVNCYLQKVMVQVDEDGEVNIDYIKIPDSDITIKRTKESKKPEIALFRSNRYLVTVRDEFRIRWDIANEDSATRIELYRDSDKIAITGVNEKTQELINADSYKYTLKVQKEGEEPEVKSLIVDVKDETSLKITGISCDGNIILGLYTYAESESVQPGIEEAHLYAIAYDAAANKSYLYFSENGSSFKKVFTNKDPNGEAILIPNELAASPGVIFKDKLWLIGGSQFDPDSLGNDAGYYDIINGKWVDIKQKEKFPERMGHSCVIVEKEIWVLGGYHPDTGTLNDIYTLKIGKDYHWKKVGFDLPVSGRCMMATAIFDHKLWLFGGAKEEPGGSVVFKDFYYYDYKDFSETRSFQPVFNNIKDDKKIEFETNIDVRAGELAVAKNKLFLLYTGRSKNNIQEIQSTPNKGEWKLVDPEKGWPLLKEFSNGHNIQAATFDNGVYFRQLQLASGNKLRVNGDSVRRFYYAEKSQ